MIDQLFDITGRTYVIPDGAGVLGSEMGCALVARGANVVILDHKPARAASMIERLQCGLGRAAVMYGDVLDRESQQKANQIILNDFDRYFPAGRGSEPARHCAAVPGIW